MTTIQSKNILEIPVPILTDLDVKSEQAQTIIKFASSLIRAAKEDRLSVVTCTHNDSEKVASILCIMEYAPGAATQSAGYVPIGMLLSPDSEVWQNYMPPAAAFVVPPPN